MRFSEPSPLSVAPAIPPVASGVKRPFWSVMIPTYNPSVRFLEETLRGVLQQDPGLEQMEIVLVDDGSPNGAPVELARRVAGERIAVHVEPKNLGLAGAWNRCVELARGQWVHILHQDDFVLPGFYDTMRRGIDDHEKMGAAFCRHAHCDELGHWFYLSELEGKQARVLPHALARLAARQRIQAPAMVVSRAAYETLGGFRSDLPYTLDWEMWCRIASQFEVWHTPRILACYRNHRSAESNRLSLTGEDIRDFSKCIRIIQDYLPAEEKVRIGDMARTHYALRALTQALAFADRRQWLPAARQARGAIKTSRAPKVMLKALYVIGVSGYRAVRASLRNLRVRAFGARRDLRDVSVRPGG